MENIPTQDNATNKEQVQVLPPNDGQAFQNISQMPPILNSQIKQPVVKSSWGFKKIFLIILVSIIIIAIVAFGVYYYLQSLNLNTSIDNSVLPQTQAEPTVTNIQSSIPPNQIFTAYIQELAGTKNFDEQVVIKKKYESKRAISELDSKIFAGSLAQSFDTGKIFAYHKMVADFFYVVTKTEIDGSSANIEASVRSDLDPSVIKPGSLIRASMIFEDGSWKIDSLSIEGVTSIPAVSGSDPTVAPGNSVYTNSKYNFSFQYPNTWKYEKIANSYDTISAPLDSPFAGKEDLKITVSTGGDSTMFESNLKKSGVKYTKDTITIDGVKATRILASQQETLSGDSFYKKDYYIYFSDKKVGYKIADIDGKCSTFITGGNECSNTINSVMDKVVSSFKFGK